MSDLITVYTKIRRYDLKDDPEMEDTVICLNPKMDYASLKRELRQFLNLGMEEDKVLKLRNHTYNLIPLSSLVEGNSTPQNAYILDIVKIQKSNFLTRTNVHLQDAYLDAIRQKVHSLENRIIQAEMLIPQLQWKRQAHMGQTVHDLSTRMAFLNQRIDELTPTQWKSKLLTIVSTS